MPKLYRPHIPLSVRCQVAERQLRERTAYYGYAVAGAKTAGNRLRTMLHLLAHTFGCDPSELRLDHHPPLGARAKSKWSTTGKTHYIPEANDPNFLNYRPHGAQHAGSHLIKTNVRGDHGQHPDRVLIKKARRAESAKSGKPPKRKIKIPSAKKPWPKRPFSNKRSK